MPNYLEVLQNQMWNNLIVIPWKRDFVFMLSRQYEFDLACEELKIAIEYQGGVYMKKSGHTNIVGQTRDWNKANEAQLMGWIVIFCNAETVKSGETLYHIKRAIKLREYYGTTNTA